MRLFVAINFHSATRARLIALREELRSKARRGNFPQDENLHLTLAFIGEVRLQQLDKIKAILDTVSFKPFDAAIESVGRFKRGGGDIWWAGLREDKPLMYLQREVEYKLALCGFEMDGRTYHPHITLGRKVITDAQPWAVEPFGATVTRIDLMNSERINGKLTYTAVYERRGSDEGLR
jgi:2'-5' RNA ligase